MQSPFTISPNPTWMYLTPSLRGTLEKIRFAIRERQGLSLIMGDVGLGKSTVMRYLVNEYQSDEYRTAWLPKGAFKSSYAFLKAVCDEFDVPPKRSLAAQSKAIEEFLVGEYEKGHTSLLFIDEGQMLSAELLEQIRILLNFESDVHKLLQIIIAGQLDLRDRILMKKNKALSSRIFAPTLLNTLSVSECRSMIQFRCDCAGVANPFVCDEVIEALYSRSFGVPRDVLRICFHAWNLRGSFNLATMTADVIEAAYQEATVQQPEAAETAAA